MSHIDERIVKMTFDNASFEKGINKTLESLEKLNEVLKNTGNTDAVSGISKSMKDIKSQLSTLNLDELTKVTEKQSIWQKFGNVLSTVGKGIGNFISKIDMGDKISKLGFSFDKASEGASGLEKSVETVSRGFSALGVIGATVLANITNSAVNAGKNLIKSFAIDPITDGFGEYELKMDSIQTILTNTARHGTTLGDVNKALNELNEYSDKTIYNFAQMTDNIGKATAAGLSLDDSVTFVKGMSNAAAGFGVDANRMAGATYQMTQALASGVVQLQDWRSLEQAGMGGELMQEEMYKAAESMGVFVDRSIPFRDSLKSGWLTSEIFIAAMKKMANDPSLLKAATEVTSFTKLLGTLKEQVGSGWAQSFEYIFGNKEQSTKLWTGLSESLGEIINKSAEARNKVLEFWNVNGGRDAVIKGLGNVFTSLGKVLGSVKEAFQEVFPPMTGKKLVEISNKFKDFTEKIKINDEAAGKIKDVFKGVFSVFDTVKDSVVDLAKGFSPLGDVIGKIGSICLTVASSIGKFATNLSQAIQKSGLFKTVASGLSTAFTWIGDALNSFEGIFTTFSSYISNLDFSKAFGFIGKGFKGIGKIIKPVADGIGKALGSIDFGTIMNVIKTGSFLKVLQTLKGTFEEVGGIAESAKGIFSSFKGIGKNVKETLNGIREALQAWQQDLEAKTLLKIAGAIGILTIAILALATIDGKSLAKSLAGLGVIFAELALAYGAIVKMGSVKGLAGNAGISASLIAMSVAMLILAGALKVLSTIDIGEMITGIVGLTAVLGTMMIAIKAFDGKHKNLSKTATGLIIFGAALAVMAGALKLLGSIDAETLGGGLVALAGVLIELEAFLAVAKYGNLSVTTATGVFILAGALVVLQHALSEFGKIDKNVILTGVAAMAGVLTLVGLFSKFSGSGTGMITTAAGLAAMSAALLVMSVSLKSLGAIQWETIGRGLTAMAAGLTILGVAAALMSGGKLILLGAGIGVMSASLLLLGVALKSMAGMSWEEIGRGLTALAGSLAVLAVAMYAMSGALVGAAAMVVMAGALAILTPQLLLLGQMSLSGVGIMILALAGAFTVLGLAGLVLTPVVPVLIGLAAAVALLGVGCVAAGVGLTAVGTGLGLIGAAVGGSGLLIVEFLRQLINLLPQMGKKAAEAFVNFVAALASSVPQLVTGFTAIITALLTAIGTLIPQIVQTALDIAVAFAKGLSQAIPQLVTAGMELVAGVLEGIAANIGRIVESAADIVINFINGVAAKLPGVIQAGINLALSFIEGVANGISNNSARLEAAIRSAIQAMAQAALAVIRGSISGFTAGGKQLLQGLVNGIKSMASSAGSAVKSCVTAAVNAAKNLGSKLISAGKSLIEGFVSGIKEKAASVAEAARNVVSNAIQAAKDALKINSPSKVFIGIGKSVDEGFALGIEEGADMADKPIENVAKRALNNMTEAIGKVTDIMSGDIDVNPVITPVMDLSNIKTGTRQLNGMLDGNTMQINGVSGKLASSIGTIQNGNNNSDIISALKDLKDNLNNNAPSYTINGITYDDGSNVVNAVETLVRAARIERRI